MATYNNLVKMEEPELRSFIRSKMNVDKGEIIDEILRLGNLRHHLMEVLIDKMKMYQMADTKRIVIYKNKMVYFKQNTDDRIKSKGELEAYIFSSEDYAKYNTKVEQLNILIEYLRQTIKEVDDLVWSCRDIMKFKQFLAGK